MDYLNVSFYQFTPIADPRLWKEKIEKEFQAKALKGTILLAGEGINGFLSGSREIVESALQWIRSQPGFSELWAKESSSPTVPFRRFKVKIKKEIVTFRKGFTLAEYRTPYIRPDELKALLDSKKDFLLIDTRNEYEVQIGTFERAISLGVDHFVDFAKKIEEHLPEWKEKEIVTFCTGGIRCEKAAPYMKALGFKNVRQLEGGILNYFEKEQGKHWNGECFVFDDRIGVTKDLQPSGATLCTHCQWPNPKGVSTCQHCGRR